MTFKTVKPQNTVNEIPFRLLFLSQQLSLSFPLPLPLPHVFHTSTSRCCQITSVDSHFLQLFQKIAATFIETQVIIISKTEVPACYSPLQVCVKYYGKWSPSNALLQHMNLRITGLWLHSYRYIYVCICVNKYVYREQYARPHIICEYAILRNIKMKTKWKSRRHRKSDIEWVPYNSDFWFLPHFKYQPQKGSLGKEKGFPLYGVPRDGRTYRGRCT